MDYPEIIFRQMTVGPMGNFQYFIGDSKTGEIGIVDPAWDEDYLLSEAEKSDHKIRCVLLTHGHYDHTDAALTIAEKFNIPVYISKHETDMYLPKSPNIKLVADKEKIKIGTIEIECLHTPGHSEGCQCFKYRDILITGDTLFVDGCGRCDLPGGDPKKMYYSLYDIILKLPDSTTIYSGHQYGPSSFATLEDQKKTNPYLQSTSLEDFLARRMGL